MGFGLRPLGQELWTAALPLPESDSIEPKAPNPKPYSGLLWGADNFRKGVVFLILAWGDVELKVRASKSKPGKIAEA